MAQRAAAAIAIQAGDPATAAERALAAAAAADESGAPVEAARARTLAGRALASANRRELAVAQLERAAQQLDACGAVRFRREAEHELRKLGRHIHHRSRPGKAAGAGVETLTQREAEIARLVLDRRTNPEIANQLFLSVKTVDTHLRNIFRKLDVSSRVEVARALERAERTR
jgi:DNA-binding CsgD family transcriptional regulator